MKFAFVLLKLFLLSRRIMAVKSDEVAIPNTGSAHPLVPSHLIVTVAW